ncbi:MAG TPA: LLM class flavin-dependent oxidoreductase [Acidimicrobiia bacterium]|nr:LLM class flavin-dependent oxidoreductase [Acidimicrobiia bacterium]
MAESIPDPALVILVGPSGSGKSTWASKRFRPEEIVSSDQLRALVGSGEHDLDASGDAFDLLDRIVAARLGRRLMTVVDSLGLDQERREAHMRQATAAGMPSLMVVFDTPEREVRARNRARVRPVPEKVVTSQLRRYRQIRPTLEEKGALVVAGAQEVQPSHSPTAADKADRQRQQPLGLRFYLQISRFPYDDLAAGTSEVVGAAEAMGFAGVALMDHLVQIPQVGREWEAMPEAYTTLAYLAANTSKVELGTLVTGATLRNPGLLAKTIATLDVLSGGRAFCGLGAGWFAAEQESFGYTFGSPAERVAALEDALNILPLMWGPGKATHRGELSSVENAVCYPRPLREKIPILVGGRGRRVIDLALTYADGLNVSVADLPKMRPLVEEGLISRGRGRETFELSVLDTPLIGRNRTEVAGLVERHRGGRSSSEFTKRFHAGSIDVHIGRYREMAEAGVGAVFVAPLGLDSPQALQPWRQVIEAFRQAP